MAFLTLTPGVGSPVDVKVESFERAPDERGGGGLQRTLGGHLRGVSDWVKRGWTGNLLALDDAERDAVLALLDPDAEIGISGDSVPNVTVRASVTGDMPYIRTAGGWYYRIPVRFQEV